MNSRPTFDEIATPNRSSGIAGRLLSGPTVLGLAARFAAGLAAGRGRPRRFGSTVIVIAHAHVLEALRRDLDFGIAPVNAARIADVDQAFVLGMDRQSVLAKERAALYRALAAVDLDPIRSAAEVLASECIGDRPEVDAVGGYARVVAGQTAQLLFGIRGGDDALFREVARSIFGHTFLNLSGDAEVRKRAMKAAQLLADWFDAEIRRRRQLGLTGTDMMGALIANEDLDDVGIRRTLAGMLVGSIDTTATAVAKILAVIGRDPALRQRLESDCDDLDRMRGWCLEALRRWPHNPILLRHAMRDTELGGAEIKAGDRMFLWTQAAMLDASAFPEPSAMRADRPSESYFHFGGTLHSCAGRPVNAWQIPMLVSRLLQRGVRRVGKMSWAGPFPDHLPVSFTP